MLDPQSYFEVYGSYGSLAVSRDSGEVLRYEPEGDDFAYADIRRFNIIEYVVTYGQLDAHIDIVDIGFWDLTGAYTAPEYGACRRMYNQYEDLPALVTLPATALCDYVYRTVRDWSDWGNHKMERVLLPPHQFTRDCPYGIRRRDYHEFRGDTEIDVSSVALFPLVPL